MFLGCVRTATLGAIVGHKPGSGAVAFGSDVALVVSPKTHDLVRTSCLAALGIMGSVFVSTFQLFTRNVCERYCRSGWLLLSRDARFSATFDDVSLFLAR